MSEAEPRLEELIDVYGEVFRTLVQSRRSYIVQYRPKSETVNRPKRPRWWRQRAEPGLALYRLPVELRTAYQMLKAYPDELASLPTPATMVADAVLQLESVEERLVNLIAMGKAGADIYGTNVYSDVLDRAAEAGTIVDTYTRYARRNEAELQRFKNYTVRDVFND